MGEDEIWNWRAFLRKVGNEQKMQALDSSRGEIVSWTCVENQASVGESQAHGRAWGLVLLSGEYIQKVVTRDPLAQQH